MLHYTRSLRMAGRFNRASALQSMVTLREPSYSRAGFAQSNHARLAGECALETIPVSC